MPVSRLLLLRVPLDQREEGPPLVQGLLRLPGFFQEDRPEPPGKGIVGEEFDQPLRPVERLRIPAFPLVKPGQQDGGTGIVRVDPNRLLEVGDGGRIVVFGDRLLRPIEKGLDLETDPLPLDHPSPPGRGMDGEFILPPEVEGVRGHGQK